jgi:hypothetical protein
MDGRQDHGMGPCSDGVDYGKIASNDHGLQPSAAKASMDGRKLGIASNNHGLQPVDETRVINRALARERSLRKFILGIGDCFVTAGWRFLAMTVDVINLVLLQNGTNLITLSLRAQRSNLHPSNISKIYNYDFHRQYRPICSAS